MDTSKPISLMSTDSLEQPPLNLDTGNAENYMLSPESVKSRAFKISYGSTSTNSPVTQDEASSALNSGGEANLRQAQASSVNADLTDKRYQLITKYSSAKNGALTPADFNAIDNIAGFNFPYKYPRDPNSIVEQNFGKQFVSELDSFAQKSGDSNFWNYGQSVARNDLEAAKVFGDVTTAQYQYLVTKMQDVQAKLENQSYTGYGLDLAKMAFPILNPYYELKMRSNVPGVGFLSGGDVGTNLENQRVKLHSLPFDKFTQTVDTIYEKMSADNPQAAAVWLSAMLGQSTSDRILNAANTIGTGLDIPIAFKVGGVAFSRLNLANQIRVATKTMVKTASSPEITKSGILASAGDLRTSGVENASNLLTGRVTGSMSSVENAVNTLPYHLNLFKQEVEDAGFLSNTHQNILLEQTDGAISNSLAVLNNTVRPTRVSLQNISADISDKISKTVSDGYASENHSIIKISTPTFNPISKTYDITMWWGKDGGVFYNDIHEAGDAAIHKGFRVTYTPEQLADLDARIAAIKGDLGAPDNALNTLTKENQNLGKVHETLANKAEGIGDQYGRDSSAYSAAVAEREAARGALRESNRKLFQARKALREEGINAQEADVHGVNYLDTLPNTLKYLEDKRASVSKPGGVQIKQQGLGFYIEKVVPLNENDRVIQNLVADPENPVSVSPRSWTANIPYLNHFRTAEDTFSAEARANRKAAIYPQAAFLAMVKKEGKILDDFKNGVIRRDPVTGELNPFYKRGVPIVRKFMARGKVKEFEKALDYSQNEAVDPVTKKPGYYMTPNELNHFYWSTFQRPASFEEVQAYEAVKRWDEIQRIFSQVQVYRNQARLGNETHKLVFKLPDGSLGRSGEFTGTVKSKFPRTGKTMLIMGDDLKSSVVKDWPEESAGPVALKKGKVKDLGRTSVADKEYLEDQVRSGKMKLIELWNPEDFPFKDLGIKNGDSVIHYVLTPNVETSALRWDSLPRTGGGRFVYDYSHYIKQPNMKFENINGTRKSNYLGDTTIAPVSYRPLGEDVANKMNVVRRLIDAGQEAEAKTHFINNGLEGALEPWNKFRSKFDGFKDPDGNFHEPLYNSKEDFRVVRKNLSIFDLDKSLQRRYGAEAFDPRLKNSWRDVTRSSPARNFQVQFAEERDAVNLNAIENVGTIDNPVYQKTPAKKIDPVVMLNRGMRSTINSLFMDDYKIFAVNSWIREAMEHLSDPDSMIMSSPFSTFKTITRDSFKPGTPEKVKNALMANHFKIEQLVGTPTVLDSFVHSVAQDIADAAYGKLGPTAASYITPSWLIPKLRDPFAFIRSVTFNAYLGVFSIPQIWVQSMNYVNMFAISPKYATQGTLGTYLHYLSRFNRNPEIMAFYEKTAAKFGWKPGEWTEAMRTLEDTGFGHVGSEQAMMDFMSRTNIIGSGKDKFLEWGRKPFQMGEANSRIGAWYTAFKEFRDKNPTGKLTDTDKAYILDRADFYYGNMSVASHSMLNSGVFSLPTQFYMYTTRLAEIFWSGTRLGGTLAERNMARARLVAANAAMFGVPMSVGITGLPVSDYLRRHLLDNGYFGLTPPYVVGQNFVESTLNEGLPASLIAAATGNYYNIGPRGGLQGLSNLNEALTQDGAFYKIAGGASASLGMNTINNGFLPFVYQTYYGGYRNLKLEDFVDLFKESPVVNSGWSWWVAMNTGKWINKNADIISETSKSNASFMFLSGLRETKNQTDVWDKEQTIKARDEGQKYALKQFGLQMNRAIIASLNNDDAQADDFKRKAFVALAAFDFPPDKIGQAIMHVMKTGGLKLIDKIDPHFYIDKAPASQQDKLRKAFEYIKQHEGQ